MDEKSPIKYVKIDNRSIFALNRNKSEKRALAIYIYLSYTAKNNYAIPTDLSKLIDLLGMKHNTSSKKSIQSALSSLASTGLIDIFSTRMLDESIDLDVITKDARKTVWVRPYVSDSDINFTLIPIEYIERIIFSNNEEGAEDLIIALAYICAKTERRNGVAPVMWFGVNNIGSEIHIDGKKFVRISNTLEKMEIIYSKIADLGSGRKNYIYGLYHDKEFVDAAVSIAESNSSLDRRVKAKLDSDDNKGVIEMIGEDDYAIDLKISVFFDTHNIECNHGVMVETNRFYNKHGRDKLISILGDYNSEILSADNKIGSYRSILKRNL